MVVTFVVYKKYDEESTPRLVNKVSEKKTESKQIVFDKVENASDFKFESKPLAYAQAQIKSTPINKVIPLKQNAEVQSVSSASITATETDVESVVEEAPVSQEMAGVNHEPIYYAHSPLVDISLGVGIDYSIFRQSGNSNSTSGNFGSLALPSLALALKYRLNHVLKLNLEYQIAPGEIKTSDLAPIDQKSFNRKSTIFEFAYIFSQNHNSHYSIITGFQSHEFPFLSEDSNSQLNLLKNTFLNFSIGLGYSYLFISNYELDLILRHQNMLNSQSLNHYDLKTSSGIDFDGSLGITKIFKSGLKLGLFWFGQQHTFNYDFLRDANLSQGSQDFFDSNLQLRIGWNLFLGDSR